MEFDFNFWFPEAGIVNMQSHAVRKAMHFAHKGVDFWTGRKLSFEHMILDHVWPRSKNGPDNVFNLVPTSGQINCIKRNHLDKEAIIPILYLLRVSYSKKVFLFLESQNKLINQYKNTSEKIYFKISSSPFINFLREHREELIEIKKDEKGDFCQTLYEYFIKYQIYNTNNKNPSYNDVYKQCLKIGII
jgi:hypothetical protein